MPSFSKRSLGILHTCDQRIIRLMQAVVKDYDIMILEGHRSPKRQAELIKAGKSWTNRSKHLAVPSRAVDAAPYPLDWEDIPRFEEMGRIIKKKAKELNIKIVWGGDWKKRRDYVHTELAEE